jgi:hypothetical protein
VPELLLVLVHGFLVRLQLQQEVSLVSRAVRHEEALKGVDVALLEALAPQVPPLYSLDRLFCLGEPPVEQVLEERDYVVPVLLR